MLRHVQAIKPFWLTGALTLLGGAAQNQQVKSRARAARATIKTCRRPHPVSPPPPSPIYSDDGPDGAFFAAGPRGFSSLVAMPKRADNANKWRAGHFITLWLPFLSRDFLSFLFSLFSLFFLSVLFFCFALHNDGQELRM